jgi:hypothetical protein
MLPVYKAIALEQAAMAGGTTHPCLVQAIDESGRLVSPQVVKPFSIQHREAILAEVIGNVLAQEFDLSVPPAALVELDIEFTASLKEYPPYQHKSIASGHYFGTEYLPGGSDYLSHIHFPRLRKDIMEKIFAFDVLIRNHDRRIGKPNFFIYRGEPVLIDHEVSLNISGTFDQLVDKGQWAMMRERPHVFAGLLQKNSKKARPDFGEFFQYLRTLKPQILFSYAEQLAQHDYDTVRIGDVVNYLNAVKAQEAKFLSLLRTLLV